MSGVIVLDYSILETNTQISSIKVPFTLNNETYLLTYKPHESEKRTHIDKLDRIDNQMKRVWTGNWSKDFTHLVPYYLNGKPYLFLYKFNGDASMIDQFNPKGQGTTTRKTFNFAPGWDPIIPITKDGRPYLLSFQYDKSDLNKVKMALDKILPADIQNVWTKVVNSTDLGESPRLH